MALLESSLVNLFKIDLNTFLCGHQIICPLIVLLLCSTVLVVLTHPNNLKFMVYDNLL